MKRIISILLILLTLTGCTAVGTPSEKQYTATFLDLFDTVTTIVGRAESEEAFQETALAIHDKLEHYHRLFDIYNSYEDMANLKTVNDMASVAPVYVDSEIIELLLDCKKYYSETGGVFNPAMGSVLRLWHDAREDGLDDPENAYLPDADALIEAGRHIDADMIVIDREQSTVFLADTQLKLDVGAIAKGWATQRVCEDSPEGLLISVGGNVCATGPKDENGTPWVIGIKNPDGSLEYLHTLNITVGSVVTSGSYQRAYAVDGQLYHHIIDPEMLYPSDKWTSVTVVCEDSALADVLSTSLFILSLEDGQSLLGNYDADAMWVDTEGNKYYSTDFSKLIKR